MDDQTDIYALNTKWVSSIPQAGLVNIWAASSKKTAFEHGQNAQMQIFLCMRMVSHLGLCSLFIHSVVSNDFVSIQ